MMRNIAILSQFFFIFILYIDEMAKGLFGLDLF